MGVAEPLIFEDIKMYKKAKENGRSFSEQVEEEYKDYEFLPDWHNPKSLLQTAKHGCGR